MDSASQLDWMPRHARTKGLSPGIRRAVARGIAQAGDFFEAGRGQPAARGDESAASDGFEIAGRAGHHREAAENFRAFVRGVQGALRKTEKRTGAAQSAIHGITAATERAGQ